MEKIVNKMESEYKQVPFKSEYGLDVKETVKWKPFLRQLLVCSGVWTTVFLHGLAIGAPTVYIPQIRKETNSTVVVTDDMASWLSSVSSFSGAVFIILVFVSIRLVGRKVLYMIGVADSLAAYTVLYYSLNTTDILISSMMQGLFAAIHMIVAILIVTEYTSPEHRGLFLTIKSATFFWGIWASNALGTFFHWKIIPLFGIACGLYSLLTMMLWPESPYWLSSKGKFRECAESHRWLKGRGEDAEKELEALITLQKAYIGSLGSEKLSMKDFVIDTFRTIKSQEFYKPTSLSLLTGLLYIFSGKLVCAVYVIDIIKKITNSESTAYTGMLILDGITILSMYGGCVLAKYLKRRTLLFVTTYLTVVFLFVLSLYLYLIKLSVILENKYVSISLLILFSISVSCGPVLLSTSLHGEFIPIRCRNLAQSFISLLGKIMLATSLKIAPLLFKTFGLHGLFLTFGILLLINITILYKILPETKDKTLIEIRDLTRSTKYK